MEICSWADLLKMFRVRSFSWKNILWAIRKMSSQNFFLWGSILEECTSSCLGKMFLDRGLLKDVLWEIWEKHSVKILGNNVDRGSWKDVELDPTLVLRLLFPRISYAFWPAFAWLLAFLCINLEFECLFFLSLVFIFSISSSAFSYNCLRLLRHF